MQNNETFEKDIVERVGQLEESKKKCKSAVFKKDTDRKEGQQNKTARRIHVTIYPSVRPLNIQTFDQYLQKDRHQNVVKRSTTQIKEETFIEGQR